MYCQLQQFVSNPRGINISFDVKSMVLMRRLLWTLCSNHLQKHGMQQLCQLAWQVPSGIPFSTACSAQLGMNNAW